MVWTSPGAMLGVLNAPGVALALAIGVLEFVLLLRLSARGTRDLKAVAGPVVAILAGAAAFPLSIAWVQAPWQQALPRWLAANLATANPYVLSFPVVLLSGVVQEPAKLLAALAGVGVAVVTGARASPDAGTGRPSAAAQAVALGAAAGLAYGATEAAIVLSLVFSPAGVAPGAAGAAVGVVERVTAVLFHLSTTGIVLYAWAKGLGRGLAALVAMVLFHGVMNFLAVVFSQAGGPGILATEALVAVTAIVLFVILLRLTRLGAASGLSRAS